MNGAIFLSALERFAIAAMDSRNDAHVELEACLDRLFALFEQAEIRKLLEEQTAHTHIDSPVTAFAAVLRTVLAAREQNSSSKS